MGEKNTSAVHFLPLPLLRAVSFVLTLTMVVGDPAWAAGVSEMFRASFSHDLDNLSVSARFGTITDKSIAPKGEGGGAKGAPPLSPLPSPFVVLIQDLHANIGVQKNIAAIIEYLYHRVRIGSIYAEAAFGPCDVSLLRTLPSRRAQNRFEEKLLSKALLTGDEMAAAHVGHGPLSPVKLEGLDDPMLYLANVQAFGDLVKVGPEAAREWKSLKEILLPGAAPELRHHLELVEKLLTLRLLDHEWPQYKAHRSWMPLGNPAFRQDIAAGERVYTAAEARNGAMSENLLARIRGANAPVVMVTGGFHTA